MAKHIHGQIHENPYIRRHTYTHRAICLTHGWPTNVRFYSSSQLFGWLNCYKGTLLRSTVFARYILVHFVYGLWLSRLIRFAMFLLHGPTRGARTETAGLRPTIRTRKFADVVVAGDEMATTGDPSIPPGTVKSISRYRTGAFSRRSKRS